MFYATKRIASAIVSVSFHFKATLNQPLNSMPPVKCELFIYSNCQPHLASNMRGSRVARPLTHCIHLSSSFPSFAVGFLAIYFLIHFIQAVFIWSWNSCCNHWTFLWKNRDFCSLCGVVGCIRGHCYHLPQPAICYLHCHCTNLIAFVVPLSKCGAYEYVSGLFSFS